MLWARHVGLRALEGVKTSMNHGEHEEKVTKEYCMESATHLVGLLCDHLSGRHSG